MTLAVEKLHPDVRSVIELGGQDAKIIIFKTDPETGRKNDDPVDERQVRRRHRRRHRQDQRQGAAFPPTSSASMGFDDVKLHHVAAKCGVFAETDIDNLQKRASRADELMASLADAIVMQNLSVLTRGNTLRPRGAAARRPEHLPPLPARVLAARIPKTGTSAATPLPEDVPLEELIIVPKNAQYYAAHRRGRVRHDRRRPTSAVYTGSAELE